MSKRELPRVEVLARVRSKQLRVVDAGRLMQVSYRQAKRLLQEAKSSLTRDWRFLSAAAVLFLLLGAGLFYWRSRQVHALTEKDSILLADFVNTTNEPVFDGTLKQALTVQLEQSPFLNPVSDEKVGETLKYMGLSPDERVTKSRGLEICQRENIKAMLVGSIAVFLQCVV
jgi:eukaryotic-like serine/threonine-protein kinase